MILGAALSFTQPTANIAAICFGESKAKDLFVEVSITAVYSIRANEDIKGFV